MLDFEAEDPDFVVVVVEPRVVGREARDDCVRCDSMRSRACDSNRRREVAGEAEAEPEGELGPEECGACGAGLEDLGAGLIERVRGPVQLCFLSIVVEGGTVTGDSDR